ncbi:MAG: hypothetical protein ACJ748_10170, partial [Flavisolibacter sp.]
QILFPIIAAGLFTSCKKEQSLTNLSHPSNSQPSIAFHLKAVNTMSTVNRLSSVSSTQKIEGANITWLSGTASVSMIKFEAKKDGSEVEFKSNVNQTVNLFSDSSFIGTLSIPTGKFDEVEFKAQLSPSGNNPSLQLNAQVTNGSNTINIVFIGNENIEIKGERSNVTITDSSIHNAITSLNLSALSNGISASAISNAVVTNGQLLITASVNQDLYKQIVKNLKDLDDEEDFD